MLPLAKSRRIRQRGFGVCVHFVLGKHPTGGVPLRGKINASVWMVLLSAGRLLMRSGKLSACLFRRTVKIARQNSYLLSRRTNAENFLLRKKKTASLSIFTCVRASSLFLRQIGLILKLIRNRMLSRQCYVISPYLRVKCIWILVTSNVLLKSAPKDLPEEETLKLRTPVNFAERLPV